MDSFTTQISQLRASAAAILAQVDGLAATFTDAIPTAIPVAVATAIPLVFPEVPTHPPGTAVGAGLPPTEGGRSVEWYAEQLASLAPPAPIQAQQTLGIAVPATFGDAEANAQHYLLGESLYAPTQEQLEAEDAAYKAWREAMAATNVAPYGKKGEARGAERVARYALQCATWKVTDAKKLQERFQEYYDGTYASVSCYRANPGLYFIYRFFVFRITEGATGRGIWTPVGLLNPHAYIGAKRTSRHQNFLDFVDASQPAPVVPAKRLRNGWWLNEWDLPYEDDDDDSLSSCSSEDEEDDCLSEDGFDSRRVQVAMGGGGGGPSEAVYAPAPAPAPAPMSIASLPPIPFFPDSPPVLQRQNAVVSLSSEAPVAVAPPALPRMAHPTLERVAGTVDIMDSVVLGEKAMQYESELKALEASVWTVADMGRRERLGRAYRGGWTTLPDGRKAMLWAFHAFAPPAAPPAADYAKPCSLVHLGLYNITDRSLDTSEAPPALPKDQENWPW